MESNQSIWYQMLVASSVERDGTIQGNRKREFGSDNDNKCRACSSHIYLTLVTTIIQILISFYILERIANLTLRCPLFFGANSSCIPMLWKSTQDMANFDNGSYSNERLLCKVCVFVSVNDAVKVRMEGGVLEDWEASADVLLSDTMDQYRTFQMCERLLYSPTKLANQLLFQIPPHRQAMLIERCVCVCMC